MQFLKTILFFFIGKINQPGNSNLKASIRFSALLTSLRGAIGGTVFSNTPSGPVAKLKVVFGGGPTKTPPKKTASSQVAIWAGKMANSGNSGFVQPDGSQMANANSRSSPSNLRTVSKSWGGLLESDRQAWAATASTVTFKNKFGEPYTPNGFEYYMQNNLHRLAVGLGPAARPSCTIVKVIDDVAQEEMTCLVCDSQVVWCLYSGDWSNPNDSGAAERMQYKMNGNSDAYSIVYCSAPMGPGRSVSRSIKMIGIIKPNADYENFILRPIMNKWFGKNLSGQNYAIKVVSISPGGAQTIVSNNTVYLAPAVVGSKILYTIKQSTFAWLGTGTTIDFGSTGVSDTPLVKIILVYGLELPVLSAYTIVLTNDGAAVYSIVYGDTSGPLDLNSLLTDKYGNIPPIPLQVSFSRADAGTFTGDITITQGSETLVINLTGTAT